MKYLLSVFLLLVNFVLFSQVRVDTSASSIDLASPANKTSNWGISVMPLSSFELGIFNNYPRFRTGLQLKRGSFIYVLDLEYGNNIFTASARPTYIYYGFRPEVQYHFEYHDRGSVYCGLEAAFSYAEKNAGRGAYRSTDGVRYQFDDAVQKRIKTTAIVKIGGIQEIGKRMYADFYFGFGPGIRNINYLDQFNKRVALTEPTEEWFSSSDEIPEGNDDILAFALGCRIGYKLGKKIKN